MALLDLIEAKVPRPQVRHYTRGSQYEEVHREGITEITIPVRNAPSDHRAHLEYAIRKEALDLLAWKAIVDAFGPTIFREWILSQPTGKHARRAWCLYELLTGEHLDVPESVVSNSVPLADSSLQLTSSRSTILPRYKVAYNLLGPPEFCPLI